MLKQGEVRVVRKDQYIKEGAFNCRARGLRDAHPHCLPGKQQETVKKLKARKKGEGNHWLSVHWLFVSTIVCSFPGVGGVPPSLSLSGETSADSNAPFTARGPWGGGQAQVLLLRVHT